MIELTEEMRERIASALMDGFPVVAASVEPDGYPKLSFYGSTQVFSDDQLAIWHRQPEGGLIDRLDDNPRMAFMYRHAKDRTFWQFYGRARIDDSAETRERVYANMPEIERMLDPDKKGRPIIIDVDRVVGRGIEMKRDDAAAHA